MTFSSILLSFDNDDGIVHIRICTAPGVFVWMDADLLRMGTGCWGGGVNSWKWCLACLAVA
jgi:hypothetical protein